MNLVNTFLRGALLCGGFAAVAAPAQMAIHLKQGWYVERSTSCKNAPLAAMKQWDGTGFSGPHSSQCVATVQESNGSTYKLDDTCVALGDGTRAEPDTEHVTLQVLSPQSFRYTRQVSGGQDTAEYRWCSAR